MFLEFFIWGGWFVTMELFYLKILMQVDLNLLRLMKRNPLGYSSTIYYWLVADRYFSAQKILGVLHVIGAFLFISSRLQIILVFILIFNLHDPVYATLALVNSVAFRQMVDPSKEFPPIRVFGTVGWIIAGLTIGFLGWESQKILENTFF